MKEKVEHKTYDDDYNEELMSKKTYNMSVNHRYTVVYN